MSNLQFDQFPNPEYQDLIHAADQYALNGQFNEAQACYLNAIGIHSTIALRNDYSIFLRNNGFHHEAVQELKKLHQESLWNQNSRQLFIICQNLSSCLMEMGLEHEANIYHQQAMTWSEEADPSILMRSADFEMSRGKWETAEKLLRAASRLDCTPWEEADLFGGLGSIQLGKGEILSSIPFFWKAYRLHRKLEGMEQAGVDLLNLAEVAKSLKRDRSEIRFLNQADHCFRTAGIYSRSAELKKRIRVLSLIDMLEKQTPMWN